MGGETGELQNRGWSFVKGEARPSAPWFDGTVGMMGNIVSKRNSLS